MHLEPDLLVFDDGSPVNANSWFRRRQELANNIIPHEFGGMPPQHGSVDIIRRAHSKVRDWPGVQYATYEVNVRFPENHAISLTLSLWIPPGDGPFPILLDGDGCWRYFNDQVIHSILPW